ncbi:MAG: undecaprenyldiphospho-muramoylpentapeptide beta-N-acetylglucosaminyltransferase [Omnitrophica WOR_2 bacterium RIFCSPHIGHO2_02_FULL_45_21]|nr:MAG: undecaprenyldiphospho-muramoylpentapeptide beta-N-acetylglucosaminyltransferase [Omnitrophica WOR_2 bacterium RIFCSPHIGHO2_02_FULL_45_21]
MNRLKLLIASGASAGHLYPALAFAEKLREKEANLDIAFVSSRRGGIEESISGRGFRLFFISVLPFSFKSFKKFFPAFFSFIRSFLESFLIIEKFRPDVVVGFGSYVSFPVLLEAALFKKATVIHEQNVSLGLANKGLSFFVDKVAVGFKQTENFYAKATFTGNPLGKSLRKAGKDEARRFFNLEDKFTILTVGGSQGAHKINSEFKNSVCLIEKKEDFQFIHLTGKSDYNDLKKYYSCITMRHRVFDFLEPMHLAYSLADLVVSRAGAITIAELVYFQKAALLIPYPYAGGHQLENAYALEKEAAAIVLREEDLGRQRLSETIARLIHSPLERQALEHNIQKFAVPDAAGKLAELALSCYRKA